MQMNMASSTECCQVKKLAPKLEESAKGYDKSNDS